MSIIRPAETNESEILSSIAVSSEGYWGYDKEFMEKFESTYQVTESFLNQNLTYVLEENGKIIGFYSIIERKEETSLEYFYVEPESIGKGYGKKLWAHMIEMCKNHKIDEIHFVTSPQAKEFYIKTGAEIISEVDSLVITGRKIPKFRFLIDKREI